jgi:eukaryotic-like serine/threonine-protein kinase
MQLPHEADTALAAALAGTPYRFLGVLGRGGMSTVVEAEHTGLARRVVVKLLRPELSARPDLVDRLRIEAQALARLAHPNLVSVSDFGRTPSGLSYLVMERLEGGTFLDELRRRGFVPAADAIDLMLQALAGLDAAHRAGLVHRDVKPENLFIAETASGRVVKVLDFGVAKLADDAALTGIAPARFSTHEGSPIGTPHFAAPEQLTGSVVTPTTDVYASGLVLYELLTGQHPFAKHQTADALHHAQLIEMPPPPSSLSPGRIPPELDRAVLRAIAKSPRDRFPDAAAFARELARIRDVLAAGGGAGATSGVDSRSAPTLASEGSPRTLLSAGVLPPLSVASATTLQSAPVEPPPTLTATLASDPRVPAALPAAAPGLAPPNSEALGVLAAMLGFIATVSQLGGVLFGFRALVDPDGALESLYGHPPSNGEASGLVRTLGATTLVDGLLTAAVAATLALIGIGLARKNRRALRWVRIWSLGAILVVVLSGILRVAVMLPSQQLAFAQMPAPSDGPEAVGQSIGVALSVVLSLVIPVVELLIVFGIRFWAAHLEKR